MKIVPQKSGCVRLSRTRIFSSRCPSQSLPIQGITTQAKSRCIDIQISASGHGEGYPPEVSLFHILIVYEEQSSVFENAIIN